MRRLGVAVSFLLCSQLPSIATARSMDEGPDEASDQGEAGAGRGDPSEHPCAIDPPLPVPGKAISIRTDQPAVTLTVALDLDPGKVEKACVWTGSSKRPFYSVPVGRCTEDVPRCRALELELEAIGTHRLTVTVGKAEPVTYEVERLADDCSRRPVPALDPGDGNDLRHGNGTPAVVGSLFQAGGGPFRLTLPEPVDLGPEPSACWWFVPPGIDGEIGHQWPVSPCEGEDSSAVTCVEVSAPWWLTPGRYEGAVTVGTGDAQSATLWVPPRLSLLWLATLVGFAVWVLVTIFLKGLVVLSRLERWKEHLQRRLEASRDDHKLLLARVWAALDFATDGLRRNKLRLAFNDLSPLEQHLREAEQLLTLSEMKMRLWDRVDAQLYPPTLVAQVLTELKLFDEVVLQYNFPLPRSSGDPMDDFPPLARASDLLDAAVFDLDKNLHTSLGLALGEDDEHGEASESPGEASPPRGGTMLSSALEIISEARDREREHLRRLSPRIDGGLDFAPALRLEVDLRLDVLRKLEHLLASPELHGYLDPARLSHALDAWGQADLQDSFSHADHQRLHRDVIRWVVWRPENRRFAVRLGELQQAQHAILHQTAGNPVALASAVAAGRVPLVVRAAHDEPWRTFSPQMLSVHLSDQFRDLAESFVWRRRIQVDWQPRSNGGDAALCMVTTQRADTERVMQNGPTTVAFARTQGSYAVSPEVVLPEGVGQAAGMRIPVAPLTVRVDPGTREIQNKRVQVYNGARTTISLLGSITAAVVLFETWQEDPPLYVYWRALLLPIGIDLSTVALPAALTKLGQLLERRSSAPGALLRDDDRGRDRY